MRKIICFMIIGVLAMNQVTAQVPQKMSYQAVILDGSNQLVANQLVGMQISILQGSVAGTAIYVETHAPTTNANGLVTLEVGMGSVVLGDFSTITWGQGPFFIKTETDLTGGMNYTISGTSELLSVPYALYAERSGTATNSFTHYIGEFYEGGIIFHLWKDASGQEHGLIVSLTNQATNSPWSDVSTLIGATAQSPWDGLSNSTAIVGQTTSSAAQLCINYQGGGFTDWYLPSIDELGLLWSNKYDINKVLSSMGGAEAFLPGTLYWSSTELDANLAWPFYTLTGSDALISSYDLYKTSAYMVRAIRQF